MVLVTALVLMVVLTLVAIVAMRSTTLDLRITTNTMLRARAFESSEAARVQVVEPLDVHVFERGWGFDLPPPGGNDFLRVADTGSRLYIDSPDAPDDYDLDKVDVVLANDGDGDGAVACGNPPETTPTPRPHALDSCAHVYVNRLRTVPGPGAAISMVAGYEGLGKGAAGGGAQMYFDLRSMGYSADGARALTGSDARIVVRN
jgi:hypothetical protein